MEHFIQLWSLAVILASAFLIGWGAEAAQTFLPRALALSLLAWLQTLPEFAVEATIAWNQQRDLMIANLTGSLRLLVGLGWPMVFFVHFVSERLRSKRYAWELKLPDEDSLSVLFVFLGAIYFVAVLVKKSLTSLDSGFLILLYLLYLYFSMRLPISEVEEEDDLPWVPRQVARWSAVPRGLGVFSLFAVGGVGLYFSSHPFITTLEKWAVGWGISAFVFVQWVAPFLSEFPEKLTAFNWARQKNKAPMAVINMVSSNINQWTMLAAMIPLVFSLSLGHWEPVKLDAMHREELALTLLQSLVGGVILLDLRFHFIEASLLLGLWALQFFIPALRFPVSMAYALWLTLLILKIFYEYFLRHRVPRALVSLNQMRTK